MTEAWKQWEGQIVSGEFHLRQYLGGSDHSAVFLTERGAREPQKATIKLIPADPDNAQLQLSRWELAAKLSHPNLIRLFQIGRCQLAETPLLYVVMEYAEENLSQILPDRPLTPVETREMLGPVLDALACLHGKGFVHGRIKPANILAREDQIKISCDALCPIGESRRGSGIPSPYDPPESPGGLASSAGDIWSLGMTLVEVLTQHLPVWERTGQGDPVVPQPLPAPFLEIARHCLRRELQRRWTTADVAAHLMPPASASSVPLLKQQPSAKQPPQRPATSSLPPPRQPIARKDVSAAVRETPRAKPLAARSRYLVPIVAAVLVLAAILVVLRLLNHRPEPQPGTPSIAAEQSPEPLPAQPPADRKVQPKPEQNRVAPATEESTRKPGAETQTSGRAASSSASSLPPLPSEVAEKTPVGDRAPGEVLQQVLPDVSQKARDTIEGTVRVGVRVSVDPSGNVTEATLDSPGPSKYFADLALKAARRWDFAPAKRNGQYVSSEWLLRFHFTKTATKVFPAQTAP